MTCVRSLVAASVLCGLVGCDQGGSTASPDAAASTDATGTFAPFRRRKRGPTWAGDPRPQPSAAEVLRTSAWLPVVIERGAPTISLHWVDGNDDLGTGRAAIRLRRAAFGARAVASGAAGTIDESVLDVVDLDHGPSGLLLVGPEGTCIGKAELPVVAQRDGFGRIVEVLRTLLGCPGTSWAPIGLLSTQVPKALRWRAEDCADDEATRRAAELVKTEAALAELPAASGRLTIGDETVAWLFAGTGVWWIVVADEAAAAPPQLVTVIDHGAEPPACAPSPEPVAAPEPAEPDASEDEDDALTP